MVGKKLLEFGSGYKLYGGYFGTHSKSEKLLGKASRENEEKMKEIEQGLQAAAKKVDPRKENITIKDCMEQPLYRLFKYVLLLKEYVKKLPKSHPDFATASQAMNTFHDINSFNNDLMKNIEEQEKKVKLDSLFGGALKETRSFIAEMQADTIYFSGKIYIFNDMVIITKIESVLGTEKEERHLNMELDEFSYVGMQEDMKYFKNFLILIGKEQCIHFFFPDEGSRFELFKCMHKIFKDLRVRAFERRKLEGNQRTQKPKKMTFLLNERPQNDVIFEPEFRIEILGFEVRPLSTMTNDTAYVTRFMMPYYYEDEISFLEGEGFSDSKTQRYSKLPFGEFDPETPDHETLTSSKRDYKCINQRVEVHFSTLQEIYKDMVMNCEEKLPNIDPLTKDVNLYSKGKRKTKSFEMRKFFIEEFFNFVFRQPNILRSPIRYVKKLRINETLWNYVVERNSIMKESQKGETRFGYEHCAVCKKGKIKSLEEFEHYRGYYCVEKKHRENKPRDKYCFNFFNLVRLRLLSFKYWSFNNLERVLIFYHYLEGRLDYPFIPHINADKTVKYIRIYLPSLEENYVTVVIDSSSTAGEIVDELCRDFSIRIGLDFDLVAIYNGRTRILDRDEFVNDLVKLLDIEFEEVSAEKGSGTGSQKSGFLSSIKKWGSELFSSEEKNKLYFVKTTYLYKSLEMKSFMAHQEKRKLEVDKIFWLVKKGNIHLTEKGIIQICGLYYCLKELDNIGNFTLSKMSPKTIERVLPEQYNYQWSYDMEFKKGIGKVIEDERALIMKNKNTEGIHQKILEAVGDQSEYYTYYVVAEVKEVPAHSIEGQVPVSCLIGVNYKEFIMTKSELSTVPILSIKLDDIEYTNSVFSVFINAHDKGTFRYDSKMLFHFCELLRKYLTIHKQFPQH